MKREFVITISCFAIVLFGGLFASTAKAATRTVDRLGDSETATTCNNSVANDCSLRGAISNAGSGDTINFDPTIFNVTRQISTSLLASYVILQNLTITGPGIDLLTVRQSFNLTNFQVVGGVTLNISGMSIACNPNGGSSDGGGIFNNGTVNATNILVTQCNVSNNGGGIFNNGTLNLTNSTVSGNTALQNGGGIYNEAGKTATITNSTISGNRAPNSLGGGVYNAGTLNAYRTTFSGNFAVQSGAVFAGPISIINNSTISGNSAGIGGAAYIYEGSRLDTTNTTIANNATSGFGGGGINNQGLYQTRNTIITGNRNTTGSSDIGGTVTSFGYNLISNTTGGSVVSSGTGGQTLTGNLLNVPANLAPLGNYGGAPQTHALLPNSQAINAGDPSNSFPTDQRGALRPSGGRGDIGSFEQNITISPTTLPGGFQAAAYSQTLTATRLTSFAELFTMEKIDFLNSNAAFAPFTYSVYAVSGQSLPSGLTLSSGGVLSGTPTAAGSFTFTVQATDADGIAGFQTHTISIAANTAPTISGTTISRQSGCSPISSSTIATVNDTESGANGVTVTITSANPSNGVTVSSIVNTNGTVAANVIAACGATNATFTLRATDGVGATAASTLTVNVAPPTRTVTKTADTDDGVCDADCSLREAFTTASPNDMIEFASPLFDTAQTITLAFSQLYIDKNLTVNGRGASLLTINGNNASRVLATVGSANIIVNGLTITGGRDFFNGISNRYGGGIYNSATLTLNNSVVSGNNVTSGGDDNRFGGRGGGIYNEDNAVMTINNSTISGNTNTSATNSFAYGGGIHNANATLTINNSTISGNSSDSNIPNFGGGIFNGGTLVMTNSTVSGNALTNNGDKQGGGIYNNGTTRLINNTVTLNSISSVSSGGSSFGGGIYQIGAMHVVNTIVSGNTSATDPDLRGGFNTDTNNYLSGNALLAPLAFNGGATRTHAPLTGSPAVNAGSNCVRTANGCGINHAALTTDQRGTGFPRPAGATVDIGAFEKEVISGATISRQAGSRVSNSTIASVNDFEPNAVFTVTSANPSNNIRVSNIVNTNGTVTADVFADCGAMNANFTLTATGSGGTTATVELTVNVSGNTPPTIVYPTLPAVALGDSVNVSPTTAIDNGTIVSYSIISVSPVLTTAPTINSSGVVSITNAQGLGNHVITVRATDNCGSTTDSSFTLIVGNILEVTKTADTSDGICDSDCSLREAIAAAAPGDTIRFASPLFDAPQTITLASGQLSINKILTISGRGANLTTVSANYTSRVFNNSSTLTLNGLTVMQGVAFENSGGGGGILNSGAMTVNNCAVSGNSTDSSAGGGINNSGTMTITGSTVSNNNTAGYVASGAGIFNSGVLMIVNSTISSNVLDIYFSGSGSGIASATSLTIINSTITLNTINNPSSGGGISSSGTLNVVNTIISGNTSADNPNLSGTLNVNLNNYIGGNAGLASLVNNGGTTKTHAPLTDSPVINAGNNCVLTANNCSGINNTALTTDQRGAGYGRLIGAAVDIGALEAESILNPSTISNIADASTNEDTANGAISFTIGDAETPAANLTVAATSSNTTLVPNANIIFNGSGANRTLTITPAANQFGTTTITVTVSDGSLTAQDTFVLTVNSVNDNPTISDIPNRIIYQDASTGAIAFTIGDVETAAGSLTVSKQSSNQSLVPDANITIATVGNPNDGNRTVTVTPLAGQNGAATITVTVTDANGGAASDSFLLTVLPPCVSSVTVTNGNDFGAGSLRQAIQDVCSGGAINFAANVAQINLTSGSLFIEKSLTVNGTGANLLTVSGDGVTNVFEIWAGSYTVNLSGMKITGGVHATFGGAVDNGTGNTTTVTNCIITGNSGGGGGGIVNRGTMTVSNSAVTNNNSTYPNNGGGGIDNTDDNAVLNIVNTTVSGNTANNNFGVGGVFNFSGTTRIVNSTITNNSANGTDGIGGVRSKSGAVSVRNSIIAANINNSTVPDVGKDNFDGGAIISNGSNLVGNVGSITDFNQTGDQTGTSANTLNPRLAPLANYGGSSPTHALLQNSPALNAGSNCVLTANSCGGDSAALTTDQRGSPRKISTAVDTGAFERNIVFNQSSLSNGSQGAFYSQTLLVTRETGFAEFDSGNQTRAENFAPFTFSIVSIAGQGLPPGLSLATDGTISGTPTTQGTYTFPVKAVDGADGAASAQQFTMQVFGPTAATVSVSGRVLTPQGRGLTNATVILTDASGNTRTARTSNFGYYRFDEVEAGQTYIFNVRSKRYQFAPKVVTVTEDLSNLNFTAQE